MMIKKIFVFYSLFVTFGFYSNAQTPTTYNSAEILMHLKKLKVLGSVLYVAAHPDDENNGLLPYLAKEKMYRTAYLSLTRGDGGQNLIGSEQGVELGLIRTQELLAARKLDGSEQYFTRAYEFGYSKSATEALNVWNKEKILADVVWVIRKYQPDIIINRFPPDARAGHGHHAASAIIAREAFDAAANPKMFPEQLKYVDVWQAKRILWNTFNFGGNNTISENQLKIDIGNFNSLLGKSYGEIGAEARTMHKSQGEGRPRRRGPLFEYFSHVAGDTADKTLMDGIDISWKRLNKGAEVEKMIDEIIANYRLEQPELSVPALVQLHKHIIGNFLQTTWIQKKLSEINDLIEHCSGLFLEATANQQFGVQDDTIKINCFMNIRKNIPVVIESIAVNERDSSIKQALETNQNYSVNFVGTQTAKPADGQPYWLLKQQESEGRFAIDDEKKVGEAWTLPVYFARFYVTINQYTLTFTKPVQYKYTHLVKGELYQPISILPKISLYLTPSIALTNIQNVEGKQIVTDSNIHVVLKPNFTMKNVPVTLMVLQDVVKKVFINKTFDFEKDKQIVLDIPIKQFYNSAKGKFMGAAVEILVNNKKYVFSEFVKTISYDHIPDITYAFKDQTKFVQTPIKTVGKKIGYIHGAGDKIQEALTQLGFEVKVLEASDITLANLQQFDAIITGVRAHNIHEFLTIKYDVLMNYVQNGGNLITQYIRSNSVNNKP
ncbi:MAG: PIG-L family deacetylase, partial [Chitinophagaceae bacterium]